jgi:hypothetical protein
MQELLRHPSTRVILDRYTQAVTLASERLKLSASTAVVAQIFRYRMLAVLVVLV